MCLVAWYGDYVKRRLQEPEHPTAMAGHGKAWHEPLEPSSPSHMPNASEGSRHDAFTPDLILQVVCGCI